MILSSKPSISFNPPTRPNVAFAPLTVNVTMPVSSESLIDVPETKSLIVFISSLMV